MWRRTIAPGILCLLVVPALGVAAPAQAGDAPSTMVAKTVQVRIRSGDSLVAIAHRYGVSVSDLRRWNRKKIRAPDHIQAGDFLLVKVTSDVRIAEPDATWEGFYDIKSGDTLGGVAQRLGVRIDDLMRWNGMRTGQMIRAGSQLRYIKPGEKPPTQSAGRPTRGKLKHGEHLGTGLGYRLRFPSNAFGIPRVLRAIRQCTAFVSRRHPGTADILIGDISRPTGGRFPPHQSHQTGRDADIGYYLAGNKQNATMYRVGPSHVDHRKNWDLLYCLIRKDAVVRVYMDIGIQKAMARYVLKRKLAGKELVQRLFEAQAPEPDTALIRHAPKHDTHVHVRFACDRTDTTCHEESGDRIFRL